MPRLLREPLLHVVVLGVLLFGLYAWVAPPRASEEIVVPADAVVAMREDFRRRTGRVASATDERAMVDAWVGDEVLVREALALGLDRGDAIVRRRLIQKMEFLIENTEPVPAPTETELSAYLAAHPERYGNPERISLTQVFVSAQRAGDGAAAEAASLRARLEDGADPAALGDPFLRGREFRLYAQSELANVFGASFAAAVMRLPDGTWSEPIRSSFGVHLVRITERRPGVAPTLSMARERVERDWREERRQALDREARERLKARYVVRIEGGGS
jgi:hypothetical protein